MIYKIVIETRALQDLQNAISFYENRQKGLGNKFYQVIQKHIEILKVNPYFQKNYKDYRAIPIRKFPFKLVFYILDDKIHIISVFNTYLNPDKLPD